MSDYKTNGQGRPQGGDRRRRRRGGRNRGPNDAPESQSQSSYKSFTRPPKAKPLTGFQKFLSLVTFGLYKPSPAPRPANHGTGQPQRTPREEGPIARSDRQEREGNRGDRRERPERTERTERTDRPERAEREGRRERPPRQAPVSTEVTNERLYVGNLSYDASESDLFDLFSGSGRVQNAEVVVNNRTQRSKGFAFVTMMSVDEAKKAVADLNAKDFMGRPLVVGGAKPLAPRDERPSRDEEGQDESQDENQADEQPSGDESKPELAA